MMNSMEFFLLQNAQCVSIIHKFRLERVIIQFILYYMLLCIMYYLLLFNINLTFISFKLTLLYLAISSMVFKATSVINATNCI